MSEKMVRALVQGGKATAGPPLGPALGPLGVNVLAVVEKINEETKQFMGMRVPVEIVVNTDTKQFEVSVGIPTVAALIAKEVEREKGSGTPGTDFVGDISFDQAVKIAEAKRGQMLAKTLKGAVKEVVGACVSMGITVNGKDPKAVIKEIVDGLHDDNLKEGER